jgi:hypothetical protein
VLNYVVAKRILNDFQAILLNHPENSVSDR